MHDAIMQGDAASFVMGPWAGALAGSSSSRGLVLNVVEGQARRQKGANHQPVLPVDLPPPQLVCLDGCVDAAGGQREAPTQPFSSTPSLNLPAPVCRAVGQGGAGGEFLLAKAPDPPTLPAQGC